VIRQYLAAELIDEMRLAFAPVLLGQVERLFSGMHLYGIDFAPYKTVMGENAMHENESPRRHSFIALLLSHVLSRVLQRRSERLCCGP